MWVLEYSPNFQPGTAELCRDYMDSKGSSLGWCVGDGETEPQAGAWDESPFSVGRGFDIVVPRSTMTVEFTTNHGTPSGNENIDGDAVLEAVRDVIDGLE